MNYRIVSRAKIKKKKLRFSLKPLHGFQLGSEGQGQPPSASRLEKAVAFSISFTA